MNVLAVFSLVSSILWLFWLGSLAGVAMGHLARSQIRHSRGQQSGDGVAVAGLVVGYIGVVTLIPPLVLFVLGAA